MTAGRVAVGPFLACRWAATVPAGRIGTAGEIADTVAYLGSDAASYLHGTVLMAAGGVTA
ncbi:MAG TPA: SDR family oxidoreductase [Streptosporangiaceae bacterium]|nr:SDR family oxidoreductase [Streptosporangiaceae bacterium]